MSHGRKLHFAVAVAHWERRQRTLGRIPLAVVWRPQRPRTVELQKSFKSPDSAQRCDVPSQAASHCRLSGVIRLFCAAAFHA